MVLLDMECREPRWLMVSCTLLFILSCAPGCLCSSWFIFPFDSPSPKWQGCTVQQRTLSSRRREEWREEVSATLKGPENRPRGEFFLEYLNCESASVWFWAMGFLIRKLPGFIGLILRIIHSFRKSKYLFYGNQPVSLWFHWDSAGVGCVNNQCNGVLKV